MASPIVSVETLAAWIDSARLDLRVVDVRWHLGKPPGSGRAAYDEGHLPGAIHVDLDTELVATEGPGRHPLPDPTAFATTMAARGIGDDDLVVAYDDVGGWVAARLWWMLEDLGFGAIGGHGRGQVVVLDGGIAAWSAAGRPLATDVPRLPPATLHLARMWRRVVDRDALKRRLGDVLLLDARAAPRYRGEIEPIDAVAGHVPTAVNAPTDGNLGADGRFLDPAALRARFGTLRSTARGAGLAMECDEPGGVVTSCGSGVSACHNALAMRIAGLPDPLLYAGSYSDWTQAGELVAVGAEPGPPPVTGAVREEHIPRVKGT
ncbi:MAG: sulfurtransferase [Chloroflexi bacterium]|nr:sulfurtransferase [Chloroflexota bacterium]